MKISTKISFFPKNAIFQNISNEVFSTNIAFQESQSSAFERPRYILFKNKKIFDPSSIPFDFSYNWGNDKILKNHEFQPPQNLSFLNGSRNQRGLRKDQKFFIFLERMHSGLSNALFHIQFTQKVNEISAIEVWAKRGFFR